MPRTLHPVAWWSGRSAWRWPPRSAGPPTRCCCSVLAVLGAGGGQPPQRRPVGPGLQVLPGPGAHRDRHPGGVPVGVRRATSSQPRCTCCSRLPHIPLPSWAAGVQLGGPVTLGGTLAALYDGLRLGTLLCCLGAANALANPKRALRVLPGRPLRAGGGRGGRPQRRPRNWSRACSGCGGPASCAGGDHRALRALRSVAIPVLEDALERSLRLAAAMDSRGYGRTGGALAAGPGGSPAALMLAGMVGLCVGAYGLLDGSAARRAGPAGPGRRGRAVRRRAGPRRPPGAPHPVPARSLGAAEWAVVGCGLVPAVVLVAGVRRRRGRPQPVRRTRCAGRRCPSSRPLAILVAGLAAVVAPPPRAPGPGGRPVGGPPGSTGASRAGRPAAEVARMIEFDRVTVTYDRRPGPGAARRGPAHRRGRAGAGGRAHRRRASRPCSARSTGWCPTSPAGTLAGRVHGRRPRHADPPAPRAGRRGRRGRPGPAGRLRHRHGRRGAGLRHGAAGRAPDVMRKRVEETLGPAGHRRAAGPGPAPAVGRPAAAGGHRRRCSPPTPGSWCSTSRPRRSTRRRPRRCWPPSPGWSTTWASPWCWPSTGSSGWSSTPTGSSRCAATARSRAGPPARHAGHLDGGPAGGRARPAGRVGPAAAVGARRPPPGRAAARAPGRRHRPPAPRPVGPPGRRGDRALRARKVVRALRAGGGRPRRRPRPGRPARSTALMGRNGSGKSSLLWALQGSGPRQGGSVDGRRAPTPRRCRRPRPGGWSAWCPRPRPTCSTSTPWPRSAPRPTASRPGPPPGTARALLDRLAPGIADDVHPRDLSEGQRLALVLAVQLAAAPAVVLLDEPTRGLDYRAKRTADRHPRPRWPPRDGPWWSPPTTWSSWPPPPTGWW